MTWFRPRLRPFLEPKLEAWHLEAWRWLLARKAGPGLATRPLVLPTRQFFPPTEATGHGKALHVFDQVKRHAGMAEWGCRLAAQPREPELRLGALVSLRRDQPTAAGTFGMDEDGVNGGGRSNAPLITYDPAIPDDPWKLVAALAHELARLRLPAFPTEPPGDWQDAERMTDPAAAVMGSDLFDANCAFDFQRFQCLLSHGWKSSRLGCLEEREWVFALAVLFELTGRRCRAAA